MNQPVALDPRTAFMMLLKEADRHRLRDRALAMLETGGDDPVMDWRAACAALNALLEPLRTRGPAAGGGCGEGIEVGESTLDPDDFRTLLEQARAGAVVDAGHPGR